MVCKQHPSIILTGILTATIGSLSTHITDPQSINKSQGSDISIDIDTIVSTFDLSTLTTEITVLYISLMLLSTFYIIVR